MNSQDDKPGRGGGATGALTPERQRLLALRLQQRRQGMGPGPSIARRPGGGDPPASHPQQALWFLDDLLGPGSLYNMSHAVRLSGSLDVAALERSLREVIRRHQEGEWRAAAIQAALVPLNQSSQLKLPVSFEPAE